MPGPEQLVDPERASADPESFFDRVHRAFERAVAAVGLAERSVRIAGRNLTLGFAGPALEAGLMPALAHLEGPAASPDLRVCVWDSASTDTPMPAPPWRPEDQLAQGEIRGYNTERFRAAFDPDSVRLALCDLERRTAIFWIRDWRRLPPWESGAPLRAILHWWLGDERQGFVHGAGVGTAAGGALIVGKGGSGKSTTALACLDAGLAYAGDDYCLVSTTGAPYVHGVYSSAKLNPDSMLRFPRLRGTLRAPVNADGGKSLLFLHPSCGDQLVSGFPLRAVLVPRITGRATTTVSVLPASRALFHLAPSSLFQLPGRTPAAFAAIAAVVRSVPCYTLELGTDLAGVASAIAAVLER
jgi:hypothetical protein